MAVASDGLDPADDQYDGLAVICDPQGDFSPAVAGWNGFQIGEDSPPGRQAQRAGVLKTTKQTKRTHVLPGTPEKCTNKTGLDTHDQRPAARWGCQTFFTPATSSFTLQVGPRAPRDIWGWES